MVTIKITEKKFALHKGDIYSDTYGYVAANCTKEGEINPRTGSINWTHYCEHCGTKLPQNISEIPNE